MLTEKERIARGRRLGMSLTLPSTRRQDAGTANVGRGESQASFFRSEHEAAWRLPWWGAGPVGRIVVQHLHHGGASEPVWRAARRILVGVFSGSAGAVLGVQPNGRFQCSALACSTRCSHGHARSHPFLGDQSGVDVGGQRMGVHSGLLAASVLCRTFRRRFDRRCAGLH